MKKLVLLLIVLLFLSSIQVWADLILTETDNPGDGSAPQTTTIYLASNKMAIEQGTIGMIYLSRRQILWQYNTAKKVYFELTPESMQALKKKTDAILAKEMESIKQQMKSMPADQKAAMQKALDEMQHGDTYRFEKLGPAETVNGFRCVPIKVIKNGEPASRVCMARVSDLGMSASDVQVLVSLNKFYFNMGSNASNTPFGYPGLDKFLGYRGFPVKEADSSSGTTETVTLASVQHATAPVGVFKLSEGLTKQSMFGGQ